MTKGTGGWPCPVMRIVCCESGLPTEEGEDVLGGGVGGGQDGGAGLGEDLGAGECGGLGGEVGAADGGLGRRDVFESNAEGVGVGLERVLFECAQAAAEDGDLTDGAFDDQAGLAI